MRASERVDPLTPTRPVNDESLQGRRCPACLGRLAPEGPPACGTCGEHYGAGPYKGTLSEGTVSANFAQELDDEILPNLIPALDALDRPSCSETVIAKLAGERGIFVGNPVGEGRADVARLVPQARGVVLDVGCGYGSVVIPLSRSARHVFALDRSAARVALTGARARAEGRDNVTVIHAQGTRLPLGDETCDLVTVIGVLEWVGVGTGDPMAAQRELLEEVRRVLAPGGALLLGIENRYALPYFCGVREEHTDLRFVSLLPRALARGYVRVAKRRPYETWTHSRRALERLLARAGLTATFGYALPHYSDVQLSFDEEHIDEGRRFYLDHVFSNTSSARRVADRIIRRTPVGLLRNGLPSFWVLAGKNEKPTNVPSAVTGSPQCTGGMKLIDWATQSVVRIPRLRSDESETHDLVPGPNARRWLNAPVLAGSRRERARWLLSASGAAPAAERNERRADSVIVDRGTSEASAGLGLLKLGKLGPAKAWCTTVIGNIAARTDITARREHGDYVLSNLIVGPGTRITAVDHPSAPRWGIAGLDATMMCVDVLSVLGGARHPDPNIALTEMERTDTRMARAVYRLLRESFATATAGDATDMFAFAVLRHLGDRGHVHGVDAFYDRAARGDLEIALSRVGFTA